MSFWASLRVRLALLFGAAVLLALVVFAVAVVVALYESDEGTPNAAVVGQPQAVCASDSEDDIRQVLVAMALVGPFAVFGAAGLGFVLAGRALRPMKEASDRARVAARGATLDLQLPLSGQSDEWDELATTLNGLLTESRASLERIRRFTSDAAHELRTPLTTLVGEAELALRRERSEGELKQAVSVILSEGQRLAGLVDRLLLLARADAGVLSTSGTTVDLAQALRAAIDRLPRSSEGKVPVELAETPPVPVRGDAPLLEQLFSNLLDNALRHGRSPVRVTLTTREARAYVEITDAGPGIPLPLEAVLFDRFTRGDASRSSAGFGLGLSIARTLAEVHGGTLTHQRREGSGATFVLELPRA